MVGILPNLYQSKQNIHCTASKVDETWLDNSLAIFRDRKVQIKQDDNLTSKMAIWLKFCFSGLRVGRAIVLNKA